MLHLRVLKLACGLEVNTSFRVQTLGRDVGHEPLIICQIDKTSFLVQTLGIVERFELGFVEKLSTIVFLFDISRITAVSITDSLTIFNQLIVKRLDFFSG